MYCVVISQRTVPNNRSRASDYKPGHADCPRGEHAEFHPKIAQCNLTKIDGRMLPLYSTSALVRGLFLQVVNAYSLAAFKEVHKIFKLSHFISNKFIWKNEDSANSGPNCFPTVRRYLSHVQNGSSCPINKVDGLHADDAI
jgi:hypothetical protein